MTTRTRSSTAALALLLAGLMAAPTHAGTRKASDVSKLRSNLAGQPVKNCTKVNGRNGYYANPFCTPEEQRRFDIWEARQLGK